MPSARRVKLADVASLAQVSTGTVSLVLRDRPGPSEATRRVVMAAASELGYRPDRSASLLARRRTRMIGVTMDVRSSFHGALVESLQVEADSMGYDLVVGPLGRAHDEQRAVEMLIDSRCEGLMLLGTRLSRRDLDALGEVAAVVSIGRAINADNIDVVRAADDRGVAQAVEHIVGLGHTRVAYVDGPASPIATRRRRGFSAAAKRFRLEGATVLGQPSTEGEHTAYVCFNDEAALDVIDQVRRAGRSVPEDVSVVGFDNSPVAALASVNLTSVSQQPQPMAAAALSTVSQRLDGRSTRAEHVLEPKLIVRTSSGTAPDSPGCRRS